MEIVTNRLEQYCGFKVAGEEFAIPVMEVQEVIKPQMVTSIPLAQEQIRGLINLRGQIVTCLSLRRIFKKPDDLSKNYMNIIVRSNDGFFSLVVDEVTDIIDIDPTKLERAPDVININLRKYVDKIYKKDKGLVILLNIQKLMDIESVAENAVGL